MSPLEIEKKPWPEFAALCAWAYVADEQNAEELRVMAGRGGKDDLGPGIAAAVAVGTRAGR